jgi:uncharacterized membrane protein
MAAIVLLILALAAAGAAVFTALTPGGMTPDDELTLLFMILTCAVLLAGAAVVNAVDRLRRAVETRDRSP